MNKLFKIIVLQLVFIIPASPVLLAQYISLNDFYVDYLSAKHRDADYFSRVGGSPYHHADFDSAAVFLNGQELPILSSMRYNNCFDEMEFIPEDGSGFLILEEKETIDSIRLNMEKYQFLSYTAGKELKNGYFIVLNEGPVGLYMRQPRQFQEEKKPTGGYQDFVPAEFINLPDEFYVSFGGEPLTELPKTKKKIISMLAAKGFTPPADEKYDYKRSSLQKIFSQL